MSLRSFIGGSALPIPLLRPALRRPMIGRTRRTFSMTLRTLILAAVLLLAAPPAALADAIDGNWCSADGQHMTINGDDITTPGGKQIKGNYDRHAFDYVVPAGEPGSGENLQNPVASGVLAWSRPGGAHEPGKGRGGRAKP